MRRHVHYRPGAGPPDPPDLFSERFGDSPAPDARNATQRTGAPVGPEGRVSVINAPAVQVDTSLEAARKITQHTARIREAIWLYLRTQGARGATAGELEVALSLSGSTVRPRLLELEGRAKWAPGLPARIERTAERRNHMRVYRAL
jgi:hypothetical protein